MKVGVTAIVPAYNEGPRIGTVLRTLVACDHVIDRLVVVDDGSSDDTASAAAAFRGVDVVRMRENAGKAAALNVGMEAFPADIYLFIDADLINLKVEDVEALLQPLREDSSVAMTIGRFVGGRARTDFAQKAASFLNGQRAIRATLFDDMPDMSASGYGFETVLTKHAKRTGARVIEVPLIEVSQHMKEEKLGYRHGLIHRMQMYWHVLVSFFRH